MMEHVPPDRRKAVLDAAFRVFVTYGFRRTTMADIAEAAGISRPALYLVFKSKSEIYLAGFIDMLEDIRLNVRRAFAAAPDFKSGLLDAIDAAVLAPHRMIAGTPHGAELFTLGEHVQSGLGEQWYAAIEAELEAAIREQVAAGRLDLSMLGLTPDRFARLIMSSIEGIKSRMTSIDEAAADMILLVNVMCHALENGSTHPAQA